jgi:hypothetical protein
LFFMPHDITSPSSTGPVYHIFPPKVNYGLNLTEDCAILQRVGA